MGDELLLKSSAAAAAAAAAAAPSWRVACRWGKESNDDDDEAARGFCPSKGVASRHPSPLHTRSREREGMLSA
jgi:hypothetical protein